MTFSFFALLYGAAHSVRMLAARRCWRISSRDGWDEYEALRMGKRAALWHLLEELMISACNRLVAVRQYYDRRDELRWAWHRCEVERLRRVHDFDVPF